MPTLFTLTEVIVPQDYQRMAELMSNVLPDPPTSERLREWDQKQPADKIRQRIKAVDERGAMLGYYVCEHLPFMLAHSFYVQVLVAPQWRERGIGSQLFADAEQFAHAHGATRLEAEARDHEPAWRAWAERRGFTVDRHVFESRLELATFDEAPFAGVIEKLEAEGIRFTLLAELGLTDETKWKLYDLNRRNALDIPGSEGTFPSYADYQRFVFDASWFRPDAAIIALDDGQWVGLSSVAHFPERQSMYTQHSGVLRDYRCRGIGLALKLVSIRLAKRLGARYMRTNNDSKNEPILAVNRKLGYRPLPGYYRMLKPLQPPQAAR